MQISSNFASTAIEALRGGNKTSSPSPVANEPSSGGIVAPVDQLDLSPEAQSILSSEQSSGDIRTDKVASIRRAIADGTYDTDEKLSAALDRFLSQQG